MENPVSRQDELIRWLNDHFVSARMLGDHCSKSKSRITSVLRAHTVPVALRKSLESFQTPDGKHIPRELLPEGRDIPPGPKIGFNSRARRAEAG